MEDLDTIIAQKSREYLEARKYTTVEAIKAETNLYKQVKLLTILDYFSENGMFSAGHYHIANDARYNYKFYGDKPFFNNGVVLHNIKRYINNGNHGRLMQGMAGLLKSEAKVQEASDRILTADRDGF